MISVADTRLLLNLQFPHDQAAWDTRSGPLHKYTINNGDNTAHCSQTRKTSTRARKSENYRAIAGGITTIMPIALAVVAGGAAAAMSASQSSASKGGVRAIIEDIKLVRSPTTSVHFPSL